MQGKKACFWCGADPYSRGLPPGVPAIFANGIDRLDNLLGYIVPCCKRCNAMKSGMTAQEFLTHIRAIAEFHG